MKRILCAAAVIAMTAGAFMPLQASAQIGVSIVIGNPPPAPRYERIPPPRDGYIWAPGFWDWDGGRHVWVEGHWERMRGDSEYYRPQWREGRNGWELDRGGWRPRNDRRDRRDDDHGDRHDNGHDNYHCPPGQAKKGNC